MQPLKAYLVEYRTTCRIIDCINFKVLGQILQTKQKSTASLALAKATIELLQLTRHLRIHFSQQAIPFAQDQGLVKQTTAYLTNVLRIRAIALPRLVLHQNRICDCLWSRCGANLPQLLLYHHSGQGRFWLNQCQQFATRFKISHCLLYTSPSPRDRQKSRMPSSA